MNDKIKSRKLKEILNGYNKKDPDEIRNSKMVEKFLKEYGQLKYRREDWRGTKMWDDAYRAGYAEGRADGLHKGKEMVYEVVRLHCEDQFDYEP